MKNCKILFTDGYSDKYTFINNHIISLILGAVLNIIMYSNLVEFLVIINGIFLNNSLDAIL